MTKPNLTEKIQDRIGRGWDDARIAKSLKCSVAAVRAARNGDIADAPQVKGIAVGATTRISDKKPNEGVKARFFKLQKGRAFPVADLSEEWMVSRDTIVSHGRRLDSIKYVEVSPGDWVQCALHPDTAAQLN